MADAAGDFSHDESRFFYFGESSTHDAESLDEGDNADTDGGLRRMIWLNISAENENWKQLLIAAKTKKKEKRENESAFIWKR